VSFDWDFGDGGIPRTGADTSYAYGAAGTYTVTLTVTDDDGDVDTAELDVTVGDPPNDPPTAVATASCSGATCSFSGAGSSDPDGTIAGYLWDFGDGATATGVTVTRTFTASGTYTVELIVTDDDGDEAVTSVDVTVTVTGPPTGPIPIVPLDPARLLETRTGPDDTTIDGQAQGIGRRTAGSITELTVTNRAGVPANATAVMINLTAVLPDGNGFLTAFPCGTDQPNASSVNYAPGQVVPNAVLAKIGTNGRICIFTLAATDILVDVTGYVPAGGSPTPIDPARLLETRTGPDDTTIDGQAQGIGRRTAGSITELTVTNRAGVPANATAVMINLTAVLPDGNGFLTAFPCGTDQPNASSVNYAPGQVVPNAVLAKIGTNGRICIFTLAATDILVDVTGYVPAGGSPTPIDPARLLETRTGPDDTTIDGQAQGIGRRTAGSITELTVTNRAGVPANATAVMINLTAVLPDGNGFLTAFPCGTDQPNASSVNYAPGQVVPNAVLAKIGTNGRICIFTLAATDILVDVTGYT
jgi:chitodextrinase